MSLTKAALKTARRVAFVLGLLLAGAILFALYLDRIIAVPPEAVRALLKHGFLPAYLLVMIGTEPRPAKPHKDLSPAIAGPEAVLATGLFGAALVASRDTGTPVIAAVVALAGIIGALLLWRIARTHPGEIGEARFGPDGKPLGPWQPPEN